MFGFIRRVFLLASAVDDEFSYNDLHQVTRGISLIASERVYCRWVLGSMKKPAVLLISFVGAVVFAVAVLPNQTKLIKTSS